MASALVKLGASPPAGTGQNLQQGILTYRLRTCVRGTHDHRNCYDNRACLLRAYVRQAYNLLAEDPLLALPMKLRPALVGGHHGEAPGLVLALLALQLSALHLGSVGVLVVHGLHVHIQVVTYRKRQQYVGGTHVRTTASRTGVKATGYNTRT